MTIRCKFIYSGVGAPNHKILKLPGLGGNGNSQTAEDVIQYKLILYCINTN